MDRPSLARVRRSVLARVFAIALVVLTVIPVTAPFAAFDLAGIIGETTTHLDAAEGKLVQQALDPFSAGPPVSPWSSGLWRHHIAAAHPPAVYGSRPLVLRI
jgi:hypothetical protein